VVAVLRVVGETNIITVEVSAEDRFVGLPVPLIEAGLGACEAAVDSHAIFKLKYGCTATPRSGGLIGTIGHPDFVTACRWFVERILQVIVGCTPGPAVTAGRGIGIDIDDICRGGSAQQSYEK
jgi:hypothetical protein